MPTFARLFRANRTPAAVRALVRPSLHRAMFANYWRLPSGGWVAEHFERDTLTRGPAVYMGRCRVESEEAARDFIASSGARLARKVRFVRTYCPDPLKDIRPRALFSLARAA